MTLQERQAQYQQQAQDAKAQYEIENAKDTDQLTALQQQYAQIQAQAQDRNNVVTQTLHDYDIRLQLLAELIAEQGQ